MIFPGTRRIKAKERFYMLWYSDQIGAAVNVTDMETAAFYCLQCSKKT